MLFLPRLGRRFCISLLVLGLFALPVGAENTLPAGAANTVPAGAAKTLPGAVQRGGEAAGVASARALIDQVFEAQFAIPHIIESQILVITDRHGKRSTRHLRRFSRLELGDFAALDGAAENHRAAENHCQACYLIAFVGPRDVQGVAFLGRFQRDGSGQTYLFLPSFALFAELPVAGNPLRTGLAVSDTDAFSTAGGDSGFARPFLDSDFQLTDLFPEHRDDWHYESMPGLALDKINYRRVRAVHRRDSTRVRIHHFDAELPMLVWTDYLNAQGRPVRRRSQFDFQRFGVAAGGAESGRFRLLPNMLLMEDLEQGTHSLLRVQNRVFSAELVPRDLFTRQALIDGRHLHAEARLQ